MSEELNTPDRYKYNNLVNKWWPIIKFTDETCTSITEVSDILICAEELESFERSILDRMVEENRPFDQEKVAILKAGIPAIRRKYGKV